ncbi:porin [Labrys miyagiensis]|uniref:Porin n=1 Tax=Labrys miyagiensis TaxID=346912 RepID=A0ABQ6CYL2_9HYPH|nr:outer membrane protein [Labrys miyagiensis]GLS24130.1 porin [Labrys miyagiensis]
MKKLVLATSFVVAASIAHGADLAPQTAEPAAPVALPFNWSGPYLGLHAGYAWGREDDDQSRLFPASSSSSSSDRFNLQGFVGGAHAGYNYQINQFVLGAEADLDATGMKGSSHFSYEGGAVTGVLRLKSDVQGSARLRAGYAIDNVLLYATGGLAVADGKLSVGGVSDKNTHLGWTIGTGAEYAFTPSWIGRAELRYSDFEKKSYQTPDGPVNADWNQTSATAGVSYKF